MKLQFNKEEDGSILCQMQVGTTMGAFDYVEMLKQLLKSDTIEPDFGNLEQVEKEKLQEMIDKITETVRIGLSVKTD